MPIMRKINLINVHFWTYLANGKFLCLRVAFFNLGLID